MENQSNSSVRYEILVRKRRRLKAIKTMLVRMGCCVETLKAINHELDRVQQDINNLLWW